MSPATNISLTNLATWSIEFGTLVLIKFCGVLLAPILFSVVLPWWWVSCEKLLSMFNRCYHILHTASFPFSSFCDQCSCNVDTTNYVRCVCLCFFSMNVAPTLLFLFFLINHHVFVCVLMLICLFELLTVNKRVHYL